METKDLSQFRLQLLSYAINLKQNPITNQDYKGLSITTIAKELESYCVVGSILSKDDQNPNGKAKQILDKSLELEPIVQSENTPKIDIDEKINLIITSDSLNEIKYFASNDIINDLDENYNTKIINQEEILKFKIVSPEVGEEYNEDPEHKKSLEEFDDKFDEIMTQQEQYLKKYISNAK